MQFSLKFLSWPDSARSPEPNLGPANRGCCIECGRGLQLANSSPGTRPVSQARLTAAHRLSGGMKFTENGCDSIYSPVPAFRVGTVSMKESMSRRKSSRRQLQALCGEVHPDDGVDPRDLFRSPTNRKVTNRKTLQLCSQVADTLNLVLSGECADDVLQSLHVVAVQPARMRRSCWSWSARRQHGEKIFDPLAVLETHWHKRTADSAAKWPPRSSANAHRSSFFNLWGRGARGAGRGSEAGRRGEGGEEKNESTRTSSTAHTRRRTAVRRSRPLPRRMRDSTLCFQLSRPPGRKGDR